MPLALPVADNRGRFRNENNRHRLATMDSRMHNMPYESVHWQSQWHPDAEHEASEIFKSVAAGRYRTITPVTRNVSEGHDQTCFTNKWQSALARAHMPHDNGRLEVQPRLSGSFALP